MEKIEIIKRSNRKLYIKSSKYHEFLAGDISCLEVAEIYGSCREILFSTEIKGVTLHSVVLNGCLQLIKEGRSFDDNNVLKMVKDLVNPTGLGF